MTGLGVVAPNGLGLDELWRNLLAGRSGIVPVTLFDPAGLKSRVAGEITQFNPLDHIDPHLKPHRMARFTQLALAALQMALRNAGLEGADLGGSPRPVPVILGVSTSATDVIERQVRRIERSGAAAASPFTAIASLPQAAAAAAASVLGVESQALTVSTGCPAGLDAVAFAAERIRSGRADLALAGGADASINLLTMATFCASESMSRRNDDPAHASRPFDLHRDGGLLAEGAGILVLEALEPALARGAVPWLEIAGYGLHGDLPSAPPSSGLAASMEMALANSGCRPKDIDYISAHGPSDPVLDRVETESIKHVFGAHAHRIPVSSVKGVIGNPLSAAGAMQVIACALAARHGLIPPTANYETPDPQCDLDYVPDRPRAARLRRALVNSHGYGGSNSTLTVEAWDGAGKA